MKRFLTLALLLIFTTAGALAGYLAPEEIENPNIADRRLYVADPGGLLSGTAKAHANEYLWNLRRQTGVEAAVVVVPSIGDIPIEEFAERLFTKWGLGKSDKDNGVLVVIATEQRRARIQTGYGVEGVLPDVSALKMIQRSIVPHMKEGDLDGAVTAVAADLAHVLSDPQAAEELKSSKKEAWEEPESPITPQDIFTFIGWLAFVVSLIALGLLIHDMAKVRGKDRYFRATYWHRELWAYWVLTVCSAGAALPIALIAQWLYYRSRNKKLKCSVCGTKMRKLNEEEDNELLNDSQDLEERLHTVDYDVWECPTCGSVERFPFREKQDRFSECPKCGTVAMCLIHDHTLVPPTARREGIGEKVYECQFCRHQERRQYRIPRKDDGMGAALAAGAIIGSMGRGHGGGSGGFGGGFGGGSTGGGGASGGW